MTEAAGVGPVGHAPALGRGLGGSPAATTAALGAVSGALIGAAMGTGSGLTVGTATALRGRLDGLDVCQHASWTRIPRAVTAARNGPDARGAGLDMPTLMIHQALRRRLDILARRVGLSTTALGNLLLEAAVNAEERRLARDHRVVKALEDVLVRAILRGEYDPATAITHARSTRSGPPGEAQDSLAASATPCAAGSDGQPPLDRGRR
jgi:hypothetical protein